MKIKRLLSVFTLLLMLSFLTPLVAWIRHRFVFGYNSFLGLLFLIIVLLVIFLSVFKYYKWLNRYWVEEKNEPMVLFAMGVFCFMISCILFGTASMDIHIHDTMYIISYFWLVARISFVLGIICFIYYLFSRILNGNLNKKLSRLHFWITYIGLNLLLVIVYSGNLLGEPYHFSHDAGWASNSQIQYVHGFVSILVMLISIAQFIFLSNIIYSLVRKKNHN